MFNRHTKFSKLAVGKNVVTAKQRQGSQEQLYPLIIALSDLPPLSKVQVDYEEQPKNTFIFLVNGENVHNLVKEEVEYDPSKTEAMSVHLTVNDTKAISGSTPWIVEEIEGKISSALGQE